MRLRHRLQCLVAWLLLGSVPGLLSGCLDPDESSGGDAEVEAPAAVGLDVRPANASCLAGAAPTVAAAIDVPIAFPNLTFADPVGLFQAPGDDSRWFVLEQDGVVRVFDNDPNAMSSSVYIDLTSIVTYNPGGNDERGLLGMAFHPDFQNNGEVFLSYTFNDQGLKSFVSRFTAADPADDILPFDSREDVLVVAQPFSNHNGGGIAFGPLDGYLYIGLGDGGSGGDPRGHGQNTDTLLGAMLRIDVDNVPPGDTYGIPAGNPFAASGGCGDAGCREIFAWGLRNPWRWSFDRHTGALWLGDVGQGAWEEVDRVQVNGNYGWNACEGAHVYPPAQGGSACTAPGSIDPVTEYDRSRGVSITGGYVYRGAAIPELQGRFLFADHALGTIWAVQFDNQGNVLPIDQLELIDTDLNIASFGEGNDGELYVVHRDGSSGRIHAIVAGNNNVTVNPPADRLSDTGCVDVADPTQPAPGLIPYDLNAAFWSDNALKQRWMALPDGTSISVGSDGDWTFPPGAVLMKHFRLDGALIETRLLKRHDDDTWAGYTYEWNADGTDADLVVGGKVKDIGGQRWIYPSASQCLQCHTAAAGRSLGPETAQLNRAMVYPRTGRNAFQLSTLSAIGVLATPLGGAPADLPRLPDPDDLAEPLDARARAYLHVNCAQCHRAGGPAPVDIDFRYVHERSGSAGMNVCDVAPTRGNVGITDPRRLAPGEPGRSAMLARMARRDADAMPPLGSNRVDSVGVALVRDWIGAMGSCP